MYQNIKYHAVQRELHLGHHQLVLRRQLHSQRVAVIKCRESEPAEYEENESRKRVQFKVAVAGSKRSHLLKHLLCVQYMVQFAVVRRVEIGGVEGPVFE